MNSAGRDIGPKHALARGGVRASMLVPTEKAFRAKRSGSRRRRMRAPARNDHATPADSESGVPTDKSSGNVTNSESFFHQLLKSLSTSPERQSVISPAASGYLSMTRLNENSWS